MSDLYHQYNLRADASREKEVFYNRRLRLVSLLRLLFFVAMLVLPFYLLPVMFLAGIILPLVFLILFLFSIKYYQRLLAKRQLERFRILINEQEMNALEHRFDVFDDGAEMIDPHHFNTYDLDVFGKGSLFQYINRTVTRAGKKCLGDMLQEPMLNADDIVARQQLIGEMARSLDWRQHFLARGMMYDEEAHETSLLQGFQNEQFHLRTLPFVSILLLVLPLFSLAGLLFWIFKGSSALLVLAGLVQFVLCLLERKNIQNIYSRFGKRVKLLQKYSELLSLVESFDWQSGEGRRMYESLKESGLPSNEFRQLVKIVSAYDNRNNLLIGIFLNLFLMWDIRYSYLLIQWHERNKENYGKWSATLALIDALVSLANFACNHPDFAWPEPVADSFEIVSAQMGHPLIHPQKRINNDFHFLQQNKVMIITGANMAGKSTFLRTVGVNMLLAMAGAPVCAASMRFKPLVVFSNMRTTDSLFDDESYFFAELKRIKTFLDELEQGRELLIILDEILKGTNSADKLSGSQQLVRRLVQYDAHVIIATHDLKLTEIEKEFPEKVLNRCFEIEIRDDEMHFDYQLRNGITTVMNATFLMKKMGIIA